MKVLGNLLHGMIFIVSAPAGTGKTTLVERLVRENSSVVQSISFTTRKRRVGEIPGTHYQYISKEEFQKKIDAGDFLEYVELYGDYYGTSKSWVENELAKGKHVILVIDTQGALKLKGNVDACYIFIKPPSLEILKQRLMARKTDSEEAILKRTAWAEKEIEYAKFYDYLIVNDDLEVAYQVLISILVAEEHRIYRGSSPNRYD